MKNLGLGQTITVLANISVIAGIIFLAIEIRQTNRALVGATYQTRSIEMAERAELMAESDLMGDAIRKTETEGIAALSDEETGRVFNASRAQYYRIDSWFYQYELGLLDQDYYETIFAAELRRWVPRWRELGVLERFRREGSIRPSFAAEIEKYVDLPSDIPQ